MTLTGNVVIKTYVEGDSIVEAEAEADELLAMQMHLTLFIMIILLLE